MATQVEKPPITQRINQRVFAGFTPQQVARLFEGKNIQPNSREGAELLAKATKTATKMLARGGLISGYIEGGDVTQPVEPAAGSPEQTQASLREKENALAAAKQELESLKQQLANLGTDAESDAERTRLTEAIKAAEVKVTQAQADSAGASSAYTSSTLPTAAEAVGTTTTLPETMVTQQESQAVTQPQIDTGTIDTGTGEMGDPAEYTAATADTAQAEVPIQTDANLAETSTSQEGVEDALENFAPAEGAVSDEAQMEAAQQNIEDLAINDVEAATTDGTQITTPAKREVQEGELINSTFDATKAADFVEGVEAATGAPSTAATVKGQLTDLMSDFEEGDPPVWAAGAMRNAMAIMARRGMSASSMQGQAIMQAAMESAMPIAAADAATFSRFEEQNLSNKQAMATLYAQHRAQAIGKEFDQKFQVAVQNAAKISDIANMNFSAEQQIALENANLAQTADLANLSNFQAVVMAQAAGFQQADMSNLNNVQQAQAQNASSFLQMDLSNLTNEQAGAMFKAQSVIQSLFTDQAAENATSQFNATSQNQTDQFFSSLISQVNQSNAAQKNSTEQFNAGQENAAAEFNAKVKNLRDQFNAANQLVIAQANAQWRQNLTTAFNAAVNDANRSDALQANGLTQKGLDELWQKERDLLSFAFLAGESAADRTNQLVLQKIKESSDEDTAWSSSLGAFGSAIINGIFGLYQPTGT